MISVVIKQPIQHKFYIRHKETGKFVGMDGYYKDDTTDAAAFNTRDRAVSHVRDGEHVVEFFNGSQREYYIRHKSTGKFLNSDKSAYVDVRHPNKLILNAFEEAIQHVDDDHMVSWIGGSGQRQQ